MIFTLDGRDVDPRKLDIAQSYQVEEEIAARLCSRIRERRWRKAAGNLWKLICLWSA